MNIGDIVKFIDARHEMFIVVDALDFSESSKKSDDIDLELMQIYPLQMKSNYVVTTSKCVIVHAKHDSRECKSILKLLAKDRERKGWYGEPDYIKISNKNREEEAKIHSVTRLPEQLDKVEYFSFKTIDGGLDVLRDLNALIENFGDEEYIKTKEAVLDLLQFMVELEKKKK